MKAFSTQFIECKEQNMTERGPVQKFKDFPQLLPAPFHKAAPKIAKALKKDPELGLEIILCKRFGGQCRSNHPRCMAMRALADLNRNSLASMDEAIDILEKIATGKDDKIVTYGT